MFVHEGKFLAAIGRDEAKNETFCRAIGGTVNFGERTEDAMRREIREELGCEVDNLSLVTVVENLFNFEGANRHQIAFIYKGELSNKDLYKQEKIHIVEPYGEFDAEWISVEDVLSGKVILYPTLDYSKILK